jgi:hypothetical protein
MSRKTIPEPGSSDKLEPLDWEGYTVDEDEEVPVDEPTVDAVIAYLTNYHVISTLRFGDQDAVRNAVRGIVALVVNPDHIPGHQPGFPPA